MPGSRRTEFWEENTFYMKTLTFENVSQDHDALSSDDIIGEVSIPILKSVRKPTRTWFDLFAPADMSADGATMGSLELSVHCRESESERERARSELACVSE